MEAGRHWTQRRRVEILSEGQQVDLGDANTTRVQIYSKIADAFRFYTAAMPNKGLETFRRLATWSKLSEEEKLIAYNELACHEVHLFLYFKDRPFFDKAIRPFLADKYQGQLIDAWVLDRPLDSYQDLWQHRKLNAFERVLMAHRIPSTRAGQRKWLADSLDALKPPMEELDTRFEQASFQGMMEEGKGYFGMNAENIPIRLELSEGEELGLNLGMKMAPGAPAPEAKGETPQVTPLLSENLLSGGMGGGERWNGRHGRRRHGRPRRRQFATIPSRRRCQEESSLPTTGSNPSMG